MIGKSWILLFIAAALFPALHLIVYAAILRKLPIFSREKPIFLSHFSSACLCSAAALGFAFYDLTGDSIAAAVTVVFAHGIYSLSFLELWSLSQISYSREILVLAGQKGQLKRSAPPAALVQVGHAKKAGRLDSLLSLNIINYQGDTINLTPKGMILARTLQLMAWFANLRQTG